MGKQGNPPPLKQVDLSITTLRVWYKGNQVSTNKCRQLMAKVVSLSLLTNTTNLCNNC